MPEEGAFPKLPPRGDREDRRRFRSLKGPGPALGCPGPRLQRRKGKKRKNRGKRRGDAELKLSGMKMEMLAGGKGSCQGEWEHLPLGLTRFLPSPRLTHFEPLCSGAPRTPGWRLRPPTGLLCACGTRGEKKASLPIRQPLR